MDFLKEWTYTICITLIISVIFSILTPKGNMGRFFKIILATFIFLSFIYPFKSAQIDFTLPEFNISDAQSEQSHTYEKTVSTQVEQKLEKAGYSSCIAECDIVMKDNEIFIEELKVSVPSTYNADEIKQYLFDSMGINAEVYYLGE